MYTKKQCLTSLITKILDSRGAPMTTSEIREELGYNISNTNLYPVLRELGKRGIIYYINKSRGYLGNNNWEDFQISKEEIDKVLGDQQDV